MDRTTCERCGKPNSVWIDWEYRVLGNRLCFACQKAKRHEKEKQDLLDAIKEGEDYEPYSTDDGYYCPYCGEFNENNPDDYEMYEDGDHEAECYECGQKFIVNTYVRYSFESRRK